MADDTAHIDTSLVDLDVLTGWMDTRGLGSGAIEGLTPLGGGTQNIMLRFTRGTESFVLRRGPKHLRAKSNEAIRREATVLGALAGTDVPAPRLIAACEDDSVLGAVFYLMEPVDGFNASTGLPELHTGSAAVRHGMGLAAAAAAAKLGAVDHDAVGLSDFGRPDGFLERQVSRWRSELDSYSANEGYPGPDIPHLDTVSAWLDDHRPSEWRPGIMHGDYHLANLMFRNDGPEVAAIVDWEMCTVGDPLLDLGWLLASWPEPGDVISMSMALAQLGGLPSRTELVAHYGDRSTRDLTHIAWYAVLACYKLAIVLEGTHARAFAGKAPQATGDFLHSVAVQLFDRARRFSTEGIA